MWSGPGLSSLCRFWEEQRLIQRPGPSRPRQARGVRGSPAPRKPTVLRLSPHAPSSKHVCQLRPPIAHRRLLRDDVRLGRHSGNPWYGPSVAVPTYDRFIDPLLRFLAEQQEPVRCADAHDAVAKRMGLTPQDMLEVIPSGQPTYKNRLGWAHDRLKRAGLSMSPRRGTWLLTDQGRAFVAQHPNPLGDDDVQDLAKVAPDSTASSPSDAAPAPESPPPSADVPPEELIGQALTELRQSVARDLLEYVGRVSPYDFERLVLDVLHALGYGTSRSDLVQVGKSGDEGIDGIISLDRLGLEKVYVQAKRWKNQVGSPEVQTFMGALQLRGASKGILIASGPISGPAFELAKKANGSIVLIDGDRLAQLMIDAGVGVSSRAIHLPRVDSDYFEAE